MKAFSSYSHGLARTAFAAAMLLTLVSGSASAQTADDPNPGAITLTTGADFPTVYFFRGIRQEADPKFTTFAFGDVGIALASNATVNFGVWNSLHTGSSGSDADKGIHYEEDFYVSLGIGVGADLTLTPTYTAYTSPNGSFGTVKEFSLKFAHASRFAPYGLIAFELDGQADGGEEKGTYLELGASPTIPLGGPVTVAVPLKLGMSLGDYYELAGEDHGYGYFDVGVLLTVPFSKVPGRFGTWNVHGGVNFISLGETTKAFNDDDNFQVIGSFGIGMSY